MKDLPLDLFRPWLWAPHARSWIDSTPPADLDPVKSIPNHRFIARIGVGRKVR
jgi:hypothetical protein